MFLLQHDTIVAGFLSALQVYDDIRPQYAYTVFVELYCDSNRLYVCPYMYIKYFAWEDQRAKVYFIFHKVASVLYGK